MRLKLPLRGMRYLAICLFLSLLILAGSKATFAQEPFDNNKEIYQGVKVKAINGNIVVGENNLFADISNAKLERPVEVGDFIFGIGELVDDPNFQTLLKVEEGSVIKQRDVEFDGVIQQVEADSVTIFNQKVHIDSNTVINSKDKLTAGQTAFVVTENTGNGYKAFRISVLSNPEDTELAIISEITAINGKKVTLGGGFTVNISEENLDLLMRTNAVPGSDIKAWVYLNQSPKAKKLKASFVGVSSVSLGLAGKLQEVDPVNQTITILNRKIKLADVKATVFDGSFKQIQIADINPADFAYAQITFDSSRNDLVGVYLMLFTK